MRNRLEIKSEAKSILRSAHASPLLVTAIVLVVCYVLERVLMLIEYGTLFPNFLEYYNALASGDTDALLALMSSDPYLFMTDPDAALYYAGFAWPTISGTLTTTFFSILISLFTTVLYGGYYIYCMGIRQGLRMPCTTLFDGLSVAGKLIWCSILVGIKTFLWSLLFVIPGIVAAYRYRFALYNVLTDDSLSAGEAIRLSCQQTRGLKATLFVLDLSFIGWSLLASLTMGILNIWVMPYLVLCDLAYFEDAQRRLGRSPYGGSSSDSVPPPPEWEL